MSLKVTNDSHKHAGHAGNPGGEPDAETHFRIEVRAQCPCHELNVLVLFTASGSMSDGGTRSGRAAPVDVHAHRLQRCALTALHFHSRPSHPLQVVSDAFAGKPLIARHRLIYAALAEELQAGLHALQLSTKTPAEAGR